MTRTILFLGAALVLATTTRAQLFLEAHGNFLLPVGGLDMNTYNNTSFGLSGTSGLYNGGRGVGGGLTLGGTLSGAVGWEARLTYISGKESVVSYDGMSSNSENSLRSRYLRIEPALRFTSGGEGTRAYVAVGPSFVAMPRLITEEKDEYTSGAPFGGSTFTWKEEYTGGIGLGGFGAFGVLFGRGPVNFFMEVQFTAQTWAPKESTWSRTETTTNGAGSSTVSESGSTEYVTELDWNDQDKELRQRLPMSTWGMRAGLRLRLGS
ncbi:MAG: hypothetical protein JNM31_05815 [Flavobacteriales bacterium]|nr:hypothetical protein [Flavobacteriales bacterium]